MPENEPCPPPELTDDHALLRRYAQAGDNPAFAEWVRRYVDLVYSTALRCVCGDVHLAKDVTQQVFITVARRAASLASHRSLEGWLYTSTKYEAAHAIRSEQRRRRREEKAQSMNIPEESAPDWESIRPRLDQALGRLAQPDREAILLRFFLGRSYHEVGLRLGVSEDAARRRVDRALDRLRTLLAGPGVASSATALATLLATEAVTAAPAGLAGAIAAAATAAPSSFFALHALHFMTTTKFVSGVGALLVIAALGTGIRDLNATARLEADLGRLDQQVAATRQQITRLPPAIAGADMASAALVAAASLPATTARPVTAAAGRERISPLEAGAAFLAQHPEARQLWDEREKAAVFTKAGAMFRALGLTPEQVGQVEALALKQMTRNLSFNTPDGLVTLHADPEISPQEFDAQLHAIIGDKADALVKYSALAPAYGLVAQLAGSLYWSDPLSSSQIDAVAAAIASAPPASQGAGDRVDRKAIVDSVEPVLSAKQRRALEDLLAVRDARTAAHPPASGDGQPDTPSPTP